MVDGLKLPACLVIVLFLHFYPILHDLLDGVLHLDPPLLGLVLLMDSLQLRVVCEFHFADQLS